MRKREERDVERLKEKKLFLMDMDGTIYLDKTLFPTTKPFLNKIKERGGKYIFVTNNSSRSVNAYIEKLRGMGIEATKDDFLTSVDVLIWYMKKLEKMPNLCYVMGTRSFFGQLQEAGIPVTDHMEDGIDCLLAGFDSELTFQKLEDACILLNRGVQFVATNPDWVCPTWYGSVPDCGSVCEMLWRATGRRPHVVGKPMPEVVYLAMEKTGYAPEQTIMIGDRLYTDVACGLNAGVDAVLVLSGETKLEEVEGSQWTPTWIWKGIEEYLEIMEKMEAEV